MLIFRLIYLSKKKKNHKLSIKTFFKAYKNYQNFRI